MTSVLSCWRGRAGRRVGLGNIGNLDVRLGNFGDTDIGWGNAGSTDIGFKLQGSDRIGVGPLSVDIGNIGSGDLLSSLLSR
jgi:hypothetical protein